MAKFGKILNPFILIAVVHFGCSTSPSKNSKYSYHDLRLRKEYEKPTLPLTTEKVAHDLGILEHAMVKGYGGRTVIDSEIMRDVVKSIRTIKKSNTTDASIICKSLGRAFSKIPDNHLKIRNREGKVCGIEKVSLPTVGPNINTTKSHWLGKRYNNETYIIAIKSFPSGEWPGFFDFVNEAMSKAKNIIIDLRGNDGGDDSISYKLAELLAGQKVKFPFGPTLKSNSLETLTLWENNLKSLRRKTKSQNFRKALDKYLAENKSKIKMVRAGELAEFVEQNEETNFEKGSGWKYDASLGFQGKIYILQDRQTYSSGESTIDLFEFFPNVTKVGLPTAGMLHFGNVGLLVLPNSQILASIPTKADTYYDGRFIEKTGIKPDVTLKNGEDAFSKVLEMIQD